MTVYSVFNDDGEYLATFETDGEAKYFLWDKYIDERYSNENEAEHEEAYDELINDSAIALVGYIVEESNLIKNYKPRHKLLPYRDFFESYQFSN